MKTIDPDRCLWWQEHHPLDHSELCSVPIEVPTNLVPAKPIQFCLGFASSCRVASISLVTSITQFHSAHWGRTVLLKWVAGPRPPLPLEAGEPQLLLLQPPLFPGITSGFPSALCTSSEGFSKSPWLFAKLQISTVETVLSHDTCQSWALQ